MKTVFKTLAVVLLAFAATACTDKNKDTMNNDQVTDAIMARRSIRHYTDEPVSREILMKLATLGVNAPNAMNRQDWAVRIVDSKEFLDGVTEVMKEEMPQFIKADDPKFRNAFRNAPAVIFVAIPKEDPTGMLAINVGLLCENICLGAETMGLGTVVMGAPAMFFASNPKAKPFLEKLDLPEGYKLSICVGVGYPDEEPEAKPRDLDKIQFVD